jgi:hypothetical protein
VHGDPPATVRRGQTGLIPRGLRHPLLPLFACGSADIRSYRENVVDHQPRVDNVRDMTVRASRSERPTTSGVRARFALTTVRRASGRARWTHSSRTLGLDLARSIFAV